MRNRMRVIVQFYGVVGWHIGRVISARRQHIRITEGPMTNVICTPEIMIAWRRTP